MTITDLITKLSALPNPEQIVMLALPDGPVELEHVLEIRNVDGVECVGLFDGENWNIE